MPRSRFTLRLPGPFGARVRTGLPPVPGSLGLRLSAYFSRSQSLIVINFDQMYHVFAGLSSSFLPSFGQSHLALEKCNAPNEGALHLRFSIARTVI